MKRYTVCIDFDGTIVDHEFPEIGNLKPGAKEAIERIIERYDVVISSCRSSNMFKNERNYRDHVQEMKEFLEKNEIPFTRIDMGDEGKVVAIAYIDDRAVKYDGLSDSWEKIANQFN